MPKYFDVSQGSPEWFQLRAGRPTSSEFGKILLSNQSPKKIDIESLLKENGIPYESKLKKDDLMRIVIAEGLENDFPLVLSAQIDGYIELKCAELCMREPINTVGSTYWIDRGHELEAAARREYEFLTGNALEHGGFIIDDEGQYGTSPDGQIKEAKKGVELKCPAPQTHIKYALKGGIEIDYRTQIQGQMLVAEFETVDGFSYHPQMKPVITTIERDERFITLLKQGLELFRERMSEACERLHKDGFLVIDEHNEASDFNELDYLAAG